MADTGEVVEVEQPIGSDAFTELDGRPCRRLINRNLRVNWVGGGGYGRKAFHGKLTAEVQRETVARAKAKGREVEPIPVRAELI